MPQTVQFDYRQINEYRYRPIVPIDLWTSASPEVFEYEALVDSGADFCLFASEIAEQIGIVPEDGVQIQLDGIGTTNAIGYVHKIKIKVDIFESEVNVVFSDAVTDPSQGILGQLGFFDSHTITFDHPAKTFTISGS